MSCSNDAPQEPAALLRVPAEELRSLVALWDDGAGTAETTGMPPRFPSPSQSVSARQV